MKPIEVLYGETPNEEIQPCPKCLGNVQAENTVQGFKCLSQGQEDIYKLMLSSGYGRRFERCLNPTTRY